MFFSKKPRILMQLSVNLFSSTRISKALCKKQDSCEPSSSKSCITQYQHHLPCGSCIYMKCSDGQYFELPQVNMGDEAAKKFLDQV